MKFISKMSTPIQEEGKTVHGTLVISKTPAALPTSLVHSIPTAHCVSSSCRLCIQQAPGCRLCPGCRRAPGCRLCVQPISSWQQASASRASVLIRQEASNCRFCMQPTSGPCQHSELVLSSHRPLPLPVRQSTTLTGPHEHSSTSANRMLHGMVIPIQESDKNASFEIV